MSIKKITFCIAAVLLMLGFSAILTPMVTAESNVRFVCDGATGDGSNAEYPMSDIKAAVRELSKTGGTVVVCGKLSFNEYIGFSAVSETSNGNKTITVTSVYNGVDYRREKSAELRMGASIGLDGCFVFENINIRTTGSEKVKSVICGGWETVFGEGMICTKSDGAPYPSIVGVSVSEAKAGDGNITVKSGTYTDICTGNRDYETYGNTFLRIDGGVFEGQVSVSGTEGTAQTGNASLTVNGGSFFGKAGALGDVSGDVWATLNGGSFRSDLTLNGSRNELNINGCVFDKNSSIRLKNTVLPEDGTAAVESVINVTSYGGAAADLMNSIKNKDVQINISEALASGDIPDMGGNTPEEDTAFQAPQTNKAPSETDGELQIPPNGKGVSAHVKPLIIILVSVILICTAVLAVRARRL